jgi:alpha-beta hydrolase superfamily lysophospholipase
MKHSESTFTVDGLSIYAQYWEPETETRAVLLVVHGAGEHSGRYDRLAEYCATRGYAVAALDHPGHGRSEGQRVHVRRFADFLGALERFHERVSADFPGVPKFLLGHSLGGLISSHYLRGHQPDFVGCILSGPAIKTDIEPGVVQTWLIRTLSLVYPTAGVLQLDASGVSRDKAEVERYLNDPLVYNGKLTARLVSELFGAMEEIHSGAADIHLPLLLLHGGEDAMASPEGSQLLHDRVSSEDKLLKIYPGLYHEIFNEPEHPEIFRELLDWCDTQLTASEGKA